MKRNEKIYRIVVNFFAVFVILISVAIVGYIFLNSIRAIKEVGLGLIDVNKEWRPTSKNATFGLVPVIAGTIYVSFLATFIAMVFGVITSLFINFYFPKVIREFLISFIDMISGVPSVIFGFIGLSVIVRSFSIIFKMAAGQCVLAASLVLSVMLLPFVISTCNESIELAKSKYLLSFISLGLPKESLILKVIIKDIKEGIIASGVMAFGRGLGETMAVMMVIGNSPILPKLLGRGQTIPSLTALEMGNITYGSLHLSVLFSANLILLLLLIFIMLIGANLRKRAFNSEE